jgi:hypothetical protein
MLTSRAVLVLSLFLVPTVAAADCVYNGKRYAEGSRVGPLVCEGGRWAKRHESPSWPEPVRFVELTIPTHESNADCSGAPPAVLDQV